MRRPACDGAAAGAPVRARAALQALATNRGTDDDAAEGLRQAERDIGQWPGLTTSERERLAALERENRELGRDNRCAAGSHRRPSGPLRCRVDLQRTADRPSTYQRHRQLEGAPTRRAARPRRDDVLRAEIQRSGREPPTLRPTQSVEARPSAWC